MVVMLATDSAMNNDDLLSPNLWSENIEKALHYKVQYHTDSPLCTSLLSLVPIL